MTPEQFLKLTNEQKRKLTRLIHRELPIKIGGMAKDHFQDNFRKGGFVNGGLKKWKPAKRTGQGKKADGRYGTLLSSRNHLYNSIDYVPGDAKVTIQNKVPYAAVHNEGLKAGRGKGFTMPKRQFIGESKELTDKIKNKIETEIDKIIRL